MHNTDQYKCSVSWTGTETEIELETMAEAESKKKTGTELEKVTEPEIGDIDRDRDIVNYIDVLNLFTPCIFVY